MQRVILFTTGLLLSLASYALATPEAPTLTYSTDGINITASWSRVDGAISYTLYFAPYPYEGEHTIDNINMGTEQLISVDLWDGAAYYIAVTAFSDQGESEFSNIEQFSLVANDNNSMNIESCTVHESVGSRCFEGSQYPDNFESDCVEDSNGFYAQAACDINSFGYCETFNQKIHYAVENPVGQQELIILCSEMGGFWHSNE